jgi:hypothetical protein
MVRQTSLFIKSKHTLEICDKSFIICLFALASRYHSSTLAVLSYLDQRKKNWSKKFPMVEKTKEIKSPFTRSFIFPVKFL